MLNLKFIKDHAFLTSIVLFFVAILIILISNQNNSYKNFNIATVDDCLLQIKECHALLPNGAKVSLNISPKNPIATQSLSLSVNLTKIDGDSVTVNFNGINMNMGFIEYPLKKISDSKNTERYKGVGALSFCVKGKMEWLITVSVLSNNIMYNIPFRLDTFYNN